MEKTDRYAAAKTKAAANLNFAEIIAEMYGVKAATLTEQERQQIEAEVEKDFYRNTHN